MENKNGQGIFYGVIGVATLVVAIIGATFAYFSVTQSNTEGINGTTGAGAGSMSLTVAPVAATSGALIPLYENRLSDALGNTAGAACKDLAGNNACNVYKITVSNSSTTNSISVLGTLNLTGSDNMKWQVVTDNSTNTDETSFTTTGSSYAKGSARPINSSADTIAASGFEVYYVVVWLDDTGSQQDAATANPETGVTAEANTAYSGTVEFTVTDAAGRASGNLTATFTAASNNG